MKLISILLAMAMTARGASSDPGTVAIDFLEKVRVGKLDLEPGGDTALSAQTAGEKKLEIAKRLERMARDLGNDPLEVSEVKMDENFAAVLVRKIGGYDPGRLQVFPVALVKHGMEWSAAPVPASFENAGAGYAIALRKRLESLENWMLREQVLDLEKLREQSAARMRAKIQVSLPIEELRKFSPKEAAERFLAACEKKDLPAILGMLGGLSADLPNDWPARLKGADNAVNAGSQAASPWHLLTSPEVLRVVVRNEEDEGSHLVSIACLDPSDHDSRTSQARVEILHFDLSKTSDGLWRIDPPDAFLRDTADDEDETDDETDAGLVEEFPTKWRLAHPATPRIHATEAHGALIAALQADTPIPVLNLAKLNSEPALASKACIAAAKLWWTFHDPTSVHYAMPLAFQENGNAAAGLFQFFSLREPDRLDLQILYFEKSEKGWQWTPNPDTATRESLKQKIDPEIHRWTDEWQQNLLADSYELKEIPNQAAPPKEDAQKLVEEWLRACQAGDVKAALHLTARLPDPGGATTVLRNLGHEITSARRSNVSSRVSGIYQGKIWTAVGMKIDQGGKSSNPLYPVIQTPNGPRVLIEIDLFSSRGREFLNKTALDRLQKLGSATAADDLRSLFADFQNQTDIGKK
ncbi:MAG: hypothetical protein ABI162_04150 [Luteolibacter sp.]